MTRITKAKLRASAEFWSNHDTAKSRRVTAARLEAAVNRAAKSHPRRRVEYIEALNAQEDRRLITFAVGGSMLAISKEPGWEMYEGASRAKRGKVTDFSARSRQRMMEFVSSLRTSALPLFVTLTYPDWWPEAWQAWKEHLRRFWQRLKRKFPAASALWKLEPQKRGAPHYHLLIWGADFIPHEWIARAWWETVGTNDTAHLLAGTSVERARSIEGVQAYCSKNYLGKTVTLPDGWENVGRWWGILGRKNAPRAPRFCCGVTKAQAFKFRRLVRKYFRSKGIRCAAHSSSYMGRVVVFTQQILEWVRALDWACGVDIVQRGLGVPLERTPF